MKLILRALITTTLLLTLVNCYAEITNQHDHFKNINTNPYVLAIFYNSKENPKQSHTLLSVVKTIETSDIVVSNHVYLEVVDIGNAIFFDNHYKLDGKNAVRLFIRGQMIELDNFDADLEHIYNRSTVNKDLSNKLIQFIDSKLKSISIELRDISHFKDILTTKRVIGFFYGQDETSFKKYFKVAMKNIDFDFTHTSNEQLASQIFAEYGRRTIPQTPTFGIIRHEDALNEFDNSSAVFHIDLNEKPLTEFLEFERFDKLRNPSTGNEIVKRIFRKYQPLLFYVKPHNDDTTNFEAYKEAIKALPKRFIYTYAKTDSASSTAFLQLFMMADKMMVADTLSIVWLDPSRKIRIELYNGAFEKERIVEFVFKFHKQNQRFIDVMRQHLYDKDKNTDDENLISEEL